MGAKFKMNTSAFLILWKAHMNGEDKWKDFVVACFDDFAKDNDGYVSAYFGYGDFNPEKVSHVMEISTSDLTHHTYDQKYNFLSEKVYAKCSNLRSKMVNTKQTEDEKTALRKQIKLPDGYLSRDGSGKKTSTKITPDKMLAMLLG